MSDHINRPQPSRPGGTITQTLGTFMDDLTFTVIEPVDAHAVCVDFGAVPYQALEHSRFGVIAERNHVVVGAMLIDQFDLASQPTYTIARHRVSKRLKLAHQNRVRVAMLEQVGGLLADLTGGDVRVSCRVGRGKAQQSDTFRRAGWVEKPTCFTTTVRHRGSVTLRKVAGMWGEEVEQF